MSKGVKQLKKDLWKVFARFIKARDKGICFTCSKEGLSGHNYHAGHCHPGSTCPLPLYFHEQNVHGQCFRCNMYLSGNPFAYEMKIRDVYGDEVWDELMRLQGQVVKWSEQDYEDLIEEYKSKLEEL